MSGIPLSSLELEIVSKTVPARWKVVGSRGQEKRLSSALGLLALCCLDFWKQFLSLATRSEQAAAN